MVLESEDMPHEAEKVFVPPKDDTKGNDGTEKITHGRIET